MSENEEKPVSTSDGEEEIISLNEVIEEEDEMAKSALALLGSADDKQCSYDKGYMKRQALYSCQSCLGSSAQLAGICYACALRCHDTHQLLELYTKRNFRCDCGNEKFDGTNPCLLLPAKDPENPSNRYDQTFRGLYCTCHRPYPEVEGGPLPESEGDPQLSQEGPPEDLGDMVQCVICEDWFHLKHLNLATTPNEPVGEATCSDCMAQHAFLRFYAAQLSHEKENCPGKSEPRVKKVRLCHSSALEVDSSSGQTCGRESGNEENEEIGKKPGGHIWPEGWRLHLCRCAECMKSYTSHSTQFLLDPEDTLEHYESQAPPQESIDQKLDSALAKLGHQTQVELIHGYKDLKSELTEYLRTFVERGKVVTEADVKLFFEDFKKNRRNSGTEIPNFCR